MKQAMITLQASNQPTLDDVIEMDNVYASTYETVYSTAYIEREANEAYNAEELSLEVV